MVQRQPGAWVERRKRRILTAAEGGLLCASAYSIVRLIVIGHPVLSGYHGSTFSAG